MTGKGKSSPARWLAGVLASLSLALVASVGAAPPAPFNVQIVVADPAPAHSELLEAMHAALGRTPDRPLQVRTVTAREYSASGRPGGSTPDLLVTVGSEAAAAVLNGRPSVPVFCAFLPQLAYDRLLTHPTRERDERRVTALFIDQPLTRQLRLLRLAVPRAARVAVVLGPESRRAEPALRAAAGAAGLGVRVEAIDAERQLIGALHHLLDDTDVLLALPDPVVSNRHTVQNVLLTAYRAGRPVVGYSQAYVRAGALAAVFSSPAQIGRQLGEELAAVAAAGPLRLPPPQHPRYYSVDVNRRVAHSLDLDVPPADTLARRLAETEEGRQ